MNEDSHHGIAQPCKTGYFLTNEVTKHLETTCLVSACLGQELEEDLQPYVLILNLDTELFK